MVFEMFFVRQAYTQVLAHELKRIVRMLRAFPMEQFDARESGCADTARELAVGFVHRLRRIDEIAYGRTAGPIRSSTPSRGEILLELETAYLGAHMALQTLPAKRWGDVLQAPTGLSTLRQARRGLIRHSHHFALHARSVSQEVDSLRAASSTERGEFAIGV